MQCCPCKGIPLQLMAEGEEGENLPGRSGEDREAPGPDQEVKRIGKGLKGKHPLSDLKKQGLELLNLVQQGARPPPFLASLTLVRRESVGVSVTGWLGPVWDGSLPDGSLPKNVEIIMEIIMTCTV